MFAHLHCRTWFSFRAGASSPEAIAAAAAARGAGAVAITDRDGVFGIVRFQEACRAHGVKPIPGAEVFVEGAYLILLAASRTGYANLCELVTCAHLRSRERPEATLAELAQHAGDLYCLTGTWGSRLWTLADSTKPGAHREAKDWIGTLKEIFGERLSVELANHLLPEDPERIRMLIRLASDLGVSTVATGDVRYAHPDDYRLYDLLTAIRHKVKAPEYVVERALNDQAYLKPEELLRRAIRHTEAFERAAEIAEACSVDLLPDTLTPPRSLLPPGYTSRRYLWKLCTEVLRERYPDRVSRRAAAQQLRKEMDVLRDLDIEDFFLVVREVVEESRRRGIRCAGRGSAAISIIAYLLGITTVDPIRHDLLFERFINRGRKSTPDIDVDFESHRREEIIAWLEERFSREHTAMTATIVTYKLRGAIQDVGKVLGWPRKMVQRASKAVPDARAADVRHYAARLKGVLGDSARTELLMTFVELLNDTPHYLGQHSGGMILSHRPLSEFTPIVVSANGVLTTQFDKDDSENLGLLKLDVLGLRTLSAIAESVDLVRRHFLPEFDLDTLPLDDVKTFNLIRSSRTVGVFQIESPGQIQLLGSNQPDDFNDLVCQLALFRPGPVSGGMVRPFVRRRRGKEPVAHLHPCLEPVLRGTYGVILFQEQILQVAHVFSGWSYEEADAFRRLMTKQRSRREMEAMRERFVAGAVALGRPEDTAHAVFDRVSHFVGYGFPRSHSAAFALTVYQSAYLKAHFPAAFFAGVMQHHPGMYDLQVLEEDARSFGLEIFPPDINQSKARYDLERGERGRLGIRKPLTSIRGLSEDDAGRIVLERLRGPYTSIADLYERVVLNIDVLESIAQSGALDALAGQGRDALWEVGITHQRHGKPGSQREPTLFEAPVLRRADVPELPTLTLEERLEWDYKTHSAPRFHPMILRRRELAMYEVRPIDVLMKLGKNVRNRSREPLIIKIAGRVIFRMRPETANGTIFIGVEDETGRTQCIVRPEILARYDEVLRSAALVVQGELIIQGNSRGLVVLQAWPLGETFGGYEGHPQQSTGTDRWVRSLQEREGIETGAH